MNRFVELRRLEPERTRVRGRDGFRLRVDVVEAIGMPREIFGHQRVLIDPVQGKVIDEFLFVCSPYDLEIYPANAPLITQFPAFFRKSFLDIVLPSLDLSEETWILLRSDVCGLVEGLNRLDRLRIVEEFSCGELPDGSESLSEPAP